jgi:hypothetical protein
MLGRGRTILPPMPISMYRNFTDADLEAIFAYLQSIPAIRNKLPPSRWPPDKGAVSQRLAGVVAGVRAGVCADVQPEFRP